MNKAEYREYLKSDDWKRTRRRIRKRDGNRCRICDRSEGLHVHHRCYGKGIDDGDLITLCDKCHHLFHERGKVKIRQKPKRKKRGDGKRKPGEVRINYAESPNRYSTPEYIMKDGVLLDE